MDHKSEVLDSAKTAITKSVTDDITISLFSAEDETQVSNLIRHNIETFIAAKSTLAATFRRVEVLLQVYSQEGSKLYVAKAGKIAIGCGGLGPLQGLSPCEGIGEIRDLVVDKAARGKGLGTKLLYKCIDTAKEMGYHRLYLETTNNMILAQKLFLKSGFRPVLDKNSTTKAGAENQDDLPCYFLLENLNSQKQL